tara:strand:+ start:566 stop:949 length:384 start_codon:yes stop_codon:yes gene_type:complete
MNDLYIKKELETPLIEFKFDEGYLLVEGRAIPEDSMSFFEPILILLDQYEKKPNFSLNVDFKLEYFNTSSAKSIFKILVILRKIDTGLCSVIINWYFDEDDDDMFEIGQDYAHFVKVLINMKMIPND